MKNLLTIMIIGLSLLNCGQNTKNQQSSTNKKITMYDINKYIFPEAKDVTMKNYTEKLNFQIKHFDNEPIYYIRTNKQNCLIEISINDVSLVDDYEVSNLITPLEIGHILKSGTQKITVKMYPVGNLNNESLGVKDAPPITKLTDESQVAISVISIDEKSNKGFDDEKVITKKVSPKEVAGKEFYEFSFTFNAAVPYQFEGWTKGQDLRRLDQELVRKKALEFYEMVGQIFENNDLDSWLKLNYPSDLRIKSSFYRDANNLDETLVEYKNTLTGVKFKMKPIEDYRLEYMGDGKLLMILTNNLESEYRGGGALFLAHKDGFYLPSITLFLPEGRDLATQGFMMWK